MEIKENNLELLTNTFYTHINNADDLIKLLRSHKPTQYKQLIDRVCNSLVNEYVDINNVYSTAFSLHTGVLDTEEESELNEVESLVTTMYNVDELDEQYSLVEEDLEDEGDDE